MNEELQAANEELETSKEELQSLNEELKTVNNQLQRKVEELEAATNDLSNLLASTDVATVFLDRRFQIRWFTPAINAIVGILATDIGRPVSHFAPRVHDPNLLRDAQTVLDRLTPTEAEVLSESGRWYLRRIMPYRTRDDRIDGVVVTFYDISGPKEVEAEVRAAHEQITQIYDTVPHPLVVLDRDLRVRSANQAFYDTFRVQSGETEGQALYDLGNRQWDVKRLRQLLAEVLPSRETLQGLRDRARVRASRPAHDAARRPAGRRARPGPGLDPRHHGAAAVGGAPEAADLRAQPPGQEHAGDRSEHRRPDHPTLEVTGIVAIRISAAGCRRSAAPMRCSRRAAGRAWTCAR